MNMNSDHNTPDQLEKIINSNNKSKNSRLDYYKRILTACYSDIGFQNMVNTISFKEVVPLPKNNSMFRFVVKCYNNTSNVIVGAVDDNSIYHYLIYLVYPFQCHIIILVKTILFKTIFFIKYLMMKRPRSINL